jgi:antirestriction protein ArdC
MSTTTKGRTYRKAGSEAVSIDWVKFIDQMLDPSVPAHLGKTYTGFKSGTNGRGYSPMNQFWIYLQSGADSVYPAGPFGTWKALGRNVIKGSKAKTVLKPVYIWKTEKDATTGQDKKVKIGPVNYTPINTVFFYSDTEGEPLALEPVAEDWDLARALTVLDVKQVDYKLLDGNTQGYSTGREFALNPVAAHPMKTLFHELGHIVLGHTAEDKLAEYQTHRGIKEFQAEAVAYLLAHELGLDNWDASESRAYVRGWLHGGEVSDKDIRQVFGAVGKILQAGRTPEEVEEVDGGEAVAA